MKKLLKNKLKNNKKQKNRISIWNFSKFKNKFFKVKWEWEKILDNQENPKLNQQDKVF